MRKSCIRRAGKRVFAPATKFTTLYAYAQQNEKWAEWAGREISLRQAAQLEAAGEVVEIWRQLGDEVRCVGYRATKPLRNDGASPCSLTWGTTLAVAGLLKNEARAARELEKFAAWPTVGEPLRRAA